MSPYVFIPWVFLVVMSEVYTRAGLALEREARTTGNPHQKTRSRICMSRAQVLDGLAFAVAIGIMLTWLLGIVL